MCSTPELAPLLAIGTYNPSMEEMPSHKWVASNPSTLRPSILSTVNALNVIAAT